MFMDIKWIQSADNTWLLKDHEYVTVKKAFFVEEKLEMLKEVVNYLLEEHEPKQTGS